MRSQKVIRFLVLAQLVLVTLAIPAVSFENDVQHNNSNVLTFDNHGKATKINYIDKRIEKGLYYLYENQLPSGEFPTYLSLSADMKFKLNGSVIFDTALILHTLNLADKENNKKIVNEMKTGAVTFLLKNKLSHGVWRFFGKNDFIPPDVDTTSAAFAALVESRGLISDESLDYMLNNRNSEGIFYVWITFEEWLNSSNPYYNNLQVRIIDFNVNADALYAYSLRQRTLSEVINYLNDIIKNKSFVNGSVYYPSPYVFTYFVTKAYSDGNVKELKPSLDKIKKYLLKTQNPDGGWGNDLYTALATTSLINLNYKGEPLKRAIRYILNNQDKNGSWNIWYLYIQPGDSLSPTNYFGSKELTTSFSLEALIKYNKMMKIDHTNK